MPQVQTFHGPALKPYLSALAELRVQVFRAFPYLYAGDKAYEEKYLQTYSDAPNSFAVLVFDRDRVVGASTALPLRNETDEVKAPFEKSDYDLDEVFYFGESVLLPEYRGQGLGVRFFEEREREAKRQDFTLATFCAVERPADHPKRPADYEPLDTFWQNRGFHKRPNLTTTFSWQEIGEEQESPKPMMFWVKELSMSGRR